MRPKPARRSKAIKSWKTKQLNTKLRQKINLAILALIFILIILVSGQVINFLNVLQSPWRITTLSQESSFYNDSFNLNFILQSSSTALISVNPKEGTVTILEMPDKILIQAGDFGGWPIRALFALGESTRLGFGPKLMKESIGSLFGIPVDGYIKWVDSDKNSREVIEIMRQKFPASIGLISKFESDFSPVSLLRLMWVISGIRFDKVSDVNLLSQNLLDKSKLADGTEALIVDQIKLDSSLDVFTDPIIRNEDTTIAIYNATEFPNLAQIAKRLISNIGGDVIIVSNFPSVLKNSQVIGDKNSPTFKRMNEIFNLCEKGSNCDKIEPQMLDELRSRAKINIFLGEDYINKIKVLP